MHSTLGTGQETLAPLHIVPQTACRQPSVLSIVRLLSIQLVHIRWVLLKCQLFLMVCHHVPVGLIAVNVLRWQDGKFLYGVYQIEAKVSPAAGVVSSFYTRSSDVYPNNLLSDFCEIDWEFLNAAPVEPQSIWLNSFTK